MIKHLILLLCALVACFALVFAGYFFIQYEIPMEVTLIHLAWVLFYFLFAMMFFVAVIIGTIHSFFVYRCLRKRICKYGRIQSGCVITFKIYQSGIYGRHGRLLARPKAI